MKKAELKSVLKPLIRECVKEVILDEGVLSGIISEVARGIREGQPLQAAPPNHSVDPTKERMRRNAFTQKQSGQLKEHKNKLMAAIGGAAYNGVNLFEGTSPAPAQTTPSQQTAPLSGQEPTNPGVDIANLFGAVGRNWDAHMNNVKEGK